MASFQHPEFPPPGFPPLPAQFKPIQHHMKTAQEIDSRKPGNPVVCYWCRMYCLQKAMSIDKSTPECRTYIIQLMNYLEAVKKAAKDNEHADESQGMLSETVGGSIVEDYATKVFNYADQEDRAARFHKNTIKSFYTAFLLFEVMEVFGSQEDNDHVSVRRRYAKWKAWNINKCLKSGEQPIPGPVAGAEDEFGALTFGEQPGPSEAIGGGAAGGYGQPSEPNYPPQQPGYPPQLPVQPDNPAVLNFPQPPSGSHAPPSTPMDANGGNSGAPSGPINPPEASAWTQRPSTGGVQLTAQQSIQAQKYCKFAISALQYDDSKTAVKNLQNALQLLMTGEDPGS
ncbi:vacuolar protein sorting-associated protein VTA1 homolog [Lineus longissimus]|uniref:vacuolar protein sorting-associated protein VTA1 homolog n=1 Tax=Lineus longissimus TaxID=88925 RepID=UPI002B4ED380